MAAPEGSILPLEMLQEIFSYLEVQQIEESVAPVCRLWRDASLLPVVRRRLTLTPEISPSAAEKMLRLSPQLKELKINNVFRSPIIYTNDVLLAASTHNPELRVLEVVGPAVSDIGLKAVAQCDQLRSLSLSVLDCITNDGVVHLARLRNLVKLDVWDANRVTAAGWRRLFSTCDWPHLRELSLDLFEDDEYDEEPLVHFERLPTSLRSLDLWGYVSDVDLAAVAQCDQLRTLSLNEAFLVGDYGVVHLARLRNLVELDVWDANRVTPAGWRRLFSMSDWPHLRELNLPLDDEDLRREAKLLCRDTTRC